MNWDIDFVSSLSLKEMAKYCDYIVSLSIKEKTDNIFEKELRDIVHFDQFNSTSLGNLACLALYSNYDDIRNRANEVLEKYRSFKNFKSRL